MPSLTAIVIASSAPISVTKMIAGSFGPNQMIGFALIAAGAWFVFRTTGS